MATNINLSIGDISIHIGSTSQIKDWEITPSYAPFVSNSEPDIRLNMVRGVPANGDSKKFFGSYPIWDLYRSNGRSIIKFYDDIPGLARALSFESQLEEAELSFPDNTDQFIHPFYGPVLELLMVNYLAQARGTVIHSCSVKVGRSGVLFVGESGSGKSSLMRLWRQTEGAQILSDDRTIVRKNNGAFWIYGTPWHGEAEFGSPCCAHLEKIFFLQHGVINSTRPIKGADPVQNLLTCSFPPYWDCGGMDFTMDFFHDLTASIPCCEMYFKPDGDIVDFVRRRL